MIWMAAKVLCGIDLFPLQAAVYQEIYTRPYVILVGSRGFAKSWGGALTLMLKAGLTASEVHGGPGMKAVIVGSGFRQSKIVFEYMEQIWAKSPVLRSICGPNDGPKREQDRFTMRINGNTITAIPLGDGSRIRGIRANVIFVDEFNSVSEEIFETVVQGFAAVSSDPAANVEYYAERKSLMADIQKGGTDAIGALKELEQTYNVSQNQIIISGTAGYHFQPLYKAFDRYKKFIESGGNITKLKQSMPNEEIPDGFDHKDYSICRIPYALVKDETFGFMDEKTIARAKVTMDEDRYLNEFETVFTADSLGFFKASTIHNNTIRYALSNVGEQIGENDCLGHLFGMDVASEADRLAIAVIAVYPNHCKVKNVWTTDRKSFEMRRAEGLTKISDYYSFCVRKARELMQAYPPMQSHPMGAYMAIDQGGGGVAIRESFKDTDKIGPLEMPLYEMVEPGNPKPSDMFQDGDHCLWMVNFSGADLKGEFYYGGKKVIENGRVKFPEWDFVAIEKAAAQDADKMQKYINSIKYDPKNPLADNELVLYDTIEDTCMEVQRTIEELTGIVVTRSKTGNTTTFTTQGKKNAEGKIVYKHKDRATALLLALLLYQRYIAATDPAELLAMGIGTTKGGSGYTPMFAPTSEQARALNQMMGGIIAANNTVQGRGWRP